MMVAAAGTDTSARDAPEPHEQEPEHDPLAHTIPLLAIWVPIIVVVGLVIVAGFTTSDFALAGALVALMLATYFVVFGTVRLASAPPEQDDEDRPEADSH